MYLSNSPGFEYNDVSIVDVSLFTFSCSIFSHLVVLPLLKPWLCFCQQQKKTAQQNEKKAKWNVYPNWKLKTVSKWELID